MITNTGGHDSKGGGNHGNMIGSGMSNQNETSYSASCGESNPVVFNSDIVTKRITAGNGKVKEVQYATKLQDSDVLFGRGSGPNDHEGNMKFRTYVMDRKKQYMETNHRLTKTKIARSIVDLVYNSNGRFLKRLEPKEAQDAGLISASEEGEATTIIGTESSGIVYYEIQDDETCMEKAKQALRQNAAKFRNEAEMTSINSSDAGGGGGTVAIASTGANNSPFHATISSINTTATSNVAPIGSNVLFASSDTPHNSFVVRGRSEEIGSDFQSQRFHSNNLDDDDVVYDYNPIPLHINQNQQQQHHLQQQFSLLPSQMTQQLPQHQQSQRVSSSMVVPFSDLSSPNPYTNVAACALPTTTATPTSNILLSNSYVQQYHHGQQQNHPYYHHQQQQLPNPRQQSNPQQLPTQQQQFHQNTRMESISINEVMRDHNNLRRASSSCSNNNNAGMMDDLLDSLSVLMSSTDINEGGVDMVPIQQVQVQQQEEDVDGGSSVPRRRSNHNRFINNINNPNNNFLRNSLVDRRISNDTMGTIEELGSLANMSLGSIQDSIFSSYGDITDTTFINNSNTATYPTSIGGPQQMQQYNSYQGRRTSSLRSSGRKSNISIPSSAFSSFALTEMNEDDEDNDRSYLDDEAIFAVSTNDNENANDNTTTGNTNNSMNPNELDFFNQIKREFDIDYQRQQLQQQQQRQQQDSLQDEQDEKHHQDP